MARHLDAMPTQIDPIGHTVAGDALLQGPETQPSESVPQDRDRIVVVLPTLDEAANIRTVLTRIRTSLPAADVLVVDDGSTDGTPGAGRDGRGHPLVDRVLFGSRRDPAPAFSVRSAPIFLTRVMQTTQQLSPSTS